MELYTTVCTSPRKPGSNTPGMTMSPLLWSVEDRGRIRPMVLGGRAMARLCEMRASVPGAMRMWEVEVRSSPASDG